MRADNASGRERKLQALVTGIIELVAVTLFALNLPMTFFQPVAHLRRAVAGEQRPESYIIRRSR